MEGCKREIDRIMLNTQQTTPLTPALGETLLTLLETLPDAFFVVDDAVTIVYANASAQTITAATRKDLLGKPLWRGAPQLVSTMLYQAIQKATQTRAPTQVEYASPVTHNWLYVHLVPTASGLLLHVHEKGESFPRQKTVFPNEHYTADVLENMYVWVAFLTPEGLLLEINDVPLEDAQIRREEVIGQPFAETVWWTFYPASQDQLRDAITRASMGETVRFETVVHPREGMDVYLEVTVTPHRDEDHVSYLIYVGTDITARKRTEAEIRALVDAIPHFIWIMRSDGSAAYANQRWCDYTGKTLEHLQGDGWLQLIHPDDRPRIQQAWQVAVCTGTLYEVEHRIQQGCTGAYRWFLARGVPQKNAQGTILYWVGTCTDIEEQKRGEQRLKESEQNWHALAETVPQLVWTTSPDGQFEYVNQRGLDYTGVTLEHRHSDRWTHLQSIHPDDRERARAQWQYALDTGDPYEYEGRYKNNKTGEYRWFLVRAIPVRDETGQIVKWFGTCTDIDEQKQVEDALRQSQERANVLMNSSIIGIFVEENDQIIDANDTFLRMTGYTREDLHEGRMNVIHMTAPEYLARTLQFHQTVDTRQTMMPYEKEYICKDGSRLPVLVGAILFQRHPHQVIVFVLDNSVRKELEQRKDNFISMASHELRTPLTALKLQTALLRRPLARQGLQTAISDLDFIETQINALTRMVEELLDVSKIQAGRLGYVQEPVDLDALLREIVQIMQQSHPSHRILIHGAVQASLLADRERLRQVFTNLLSNAIKYSPDAQAVEIDLSSSKEAVTIRVQDHGPGIPPEQRDKIFERFYRVTGPGQGTIPGLGMGLYIVAEIVKDHGGTIMVDSDVGKGSTFTVILPTR